MIVKNKSVNKNIYDKTTNVILNKRIDNSNLYTSKSKITLSWLSAL